MDDKLSILHEFMPSAVLKALTPEAIEAVPPNLLKNEMIVIADFPFKVGRESRTVRRNGKLEIVERSKKDNSKPNNDLYLIDRGQRLNISREHFQIEKREDGYFLVDRGSACGVKIDDVAIGGGDSGGSAQLQDGNIIGVGTKETPYVYQFLVFDTFDVVDKSED